MEETYAPQEFDEYGDFAERLLALLERLGNKLGGRTGRISNSEIMSAVWRGEARELRSAVADYLAQKTQVWLLVDNLDKNWPIDGATAQQILVLRSLLDASRKIERQFSRAKVDYHSVVFLRTDIHELLVKNTSDRGKESNVSLDVVDPDVFKEILRRRAEDSLAERLDFEQFMTAFFERHVGGEDTIKYIFRHSLGRVRDVLRLTKKCVEVALNRGRQRISEDDVLAAVKSHSNDMLRELAYEIGDTRPSCAKIIDEFVGAPEELSETELLHVLEPLGVEREATLSFLLSHQFLGVVTGSEESYAGAFDFNVDRMLKLARKQGDPRFVVHPAFRAALHVGEY